MRGVCVRQLVKRYPRTTDLLQLIRRPFQRSTITALDGIDLELEPGCIHGLVGRNGAGKTTLLKILAGLVLPTEGTVEAAGVDGAKDGRHLREQVGLVVADERSFFWRLSARENLRFFATLDRLHGAESRARVESCLERVDLRDVADQPFRDLPQVHRTPKMARNAPGCSTC